MPNRSDKSAKSGANGPRQRLQARASVKTLLARFPHVQSLSLELLERNQAFREICDDYEACVAVVERLSQSITQMDGPMYREYSALCLRLEGELLLYLSANEPQRARSGPAVESAWRWDRKGEN